MCRRFYYSGWLLFMTLCIFFHTPSYAKLSKEKLEALYIYNLLEYITWTNDSIKLNPKVCVIGAAEVLLELQKIRDKVGGFGVSEKERNDFITDCNVVFIDSSFPGGYSIILNKIRDLQILSISDVKNFTSSGGMVEFSFQEDNSVKIKGNIKTLKASKIKLNAELLGIMEIIE